MTSENTQSCAEHCAKNQECLYWTFQDQHRTCTVRNSIPSRGGAWDTMSGNRECGLLHMRVWEDCRHACSRGSDDRLSKTSEFFSGRMRRLQPYDLLHRGCISSSLAGARLRKTNSGKLEYTAVLLILVLILSMLSNSDIVK